MSSMSVLHEAGDRFAIMMRGHRITVDQPESDGGADSGPTPTELFVASLASCVAFYGQRFLLRHEVPGDLSVDAQWEMASSPPRVASVSISVEAPELPDHLQSRFLKVVEHCTVHNTLSMPPKVVIALARVTGTVVTASMEPK